MVKAAFKNEYQNRMKFIKCLYKISHLIGFFINEIDIKLLKIILILKANFPGFNSSHVPTN